MKRASVYAAWAPEGEPWEPWVKPVLLASLDEDVTPEPPDEPPQWLGPRLLEPLEPSHSYREGGRARDTAIVVDLPGAIGVQLGAGLAHHGFRPVPLYNAVPAPAGTVGFVDVRPIMKALVDAAQLVRALPSGLPPAFLLDADRMGEGGQGDFDNRSLCRASDFPSAEALVAYGIRRVVLVRTQPAVDLDAIMLEWQRGGIAAWSFDPAGEGAARPIVLQQRSWFLRINDSLRSFALRRRSDGSYGMLITHGG